MNEKVKTFLCFFIVLFLFSSLSATHSFAAKQNFKIKKVKLNSEMKIQKTSGHSGGLIALSTKGKKKQRWTEIFVTYKTKLEWSDDVTLKYYVQLGSGSKAVVLSGEETYMDVACAATHKAVMYIPPSVLDRYGGVQKITVELLHMGDIQDAKSFKYAGKRAWWDGKKIITGQLRTKSESPFALKDFNEYELTKLK
ncbi:MAG: hypothetical protein KAS46_06945 [Candidatus Aureabacteria bacterium]|nr:hypothetical protein [Candidatus Auribacterota bacterium]